MDKIPYEWMYEYLADFLESVEWSKATLTEVGDTLIVVFYDRRKGGGGRRIIAAAFKYRYDGDRYHQDQQSRYEPFFVYLSREYEHEYHLANRL